MTITSWQKEDVSQNYLEQIRGGIPFGAEQIMMMIQMIHHFKPNPIKIMDLGCGNGFLSEVLLRSFPNASAILIDHSEPKQRIII